MIGTITLVLAYGINVLPVDDPHVEIAEKALQGLVATGVPGAFLVDSIPLLKYVPEWMPGAGFKKQAKYWAEWTAKMLEVPFAAAEREIVSPIFTNAHSENTHTRSRQRASLSHLSLRFPLTKSTRVKTWNTSET